MNDKGNWKQLTDIGQLDTIESNSAHCPQLIFKHSTRCNISSMALSRLERAWDDVDGKLVGWHLDLLAFRYVSNAVAERFGVPHESPQAILIIDGKVAHVSSHSGIAMRDILAAAHMK
jgi:bacillithiol system protein YtxJ